MSLLTRINRPAPEFTHDIPCGLIARVISRRRGLNRVSEAGGNFGYNAATGQYGDLVEMGVIDPTKVTRNALQNAASVAGLILTTDCMIAVIPAMRSGSPDAGGPPM